MNFANEIFVNESKSLLFFVESCMFLTMIRKTWSTKLYARMKKIFFFLSLNFIDTLSKAIIEDDETRDESKDENKSWCRDVANFVFAAISCAKARAFDVAKSYSVARSCDIARPDLATRSCDIARPDSATRSCNIARSNFATRSCDIARRHSVARSYVEARAATRDTLRQSLSKNRRIRKWILIIAFSRFFKQFSKNL